MTTELITMTEADWREYRVRKESVRQGIVNVAEDLKYIHDNKLYREEYSTFEEFVSTEFEKTRQWAYNLIGHIKVLENVNSNLHLPTQSQATHLATLPDDEQADAWAEATEKAESEGKQQPTTKDVTETVQKRKNAKGGEYKPPENDKPAKIGPSGQGVIKHLKASQQKFQDWVNYYGEAENCDHTFEQLKQVISFLETHVEAVEG